MTVADARGLAGAFRNRAGNFLLVLTKDFDRIDFVLVEREPAKESTTIGTPQPKIRPRILSVERRKPERVQLRVLRRFTWTGSDAFAQYDKLAAAYSVAYWSEDHFNNRALFSDYFLKERLPNSTDDFPEWKEDPKPAYKRLRKIYEVALPGFAGGATKASVVRAALLEPVLSELGFRVIQAASSSAADEPDFRLYSQRRSGEEAPLALCIAYPWGRFLDGKDDRLDTETPEHNPGQRVVSLLDKAEWIVITNGKLWRLYCQRAPSRASNYYEIDLDEALGRAAPHPDGPADGFRYFWLLFRSRAFERAPTGENGKAACLLDRLFEGSRQYAAELGESLKRRVFEDIFPILAEGFIANIHEREGRDADLPQERLDEVFQGVLTLLYRLLFLLYAEARDLLPVRGEARDYLEVSITNLKGEIAQDAGLLLVATEDKLKKHYDGDNYALYGRLARLFKVIDEGNSDLNVPTYNGGLFISSPGRDDESAEAAAARFLKANRLSDPCLARALDLLARDEDPKTHQLAPIDFKSLGVRQLGSIYEGLLEFKLRIAIEKKAIVKEKGHDLYVPFKDLSDRERERAEAQGRVVRKGQVHLENDKGERKASGSYYTPDHIVSYIVEHAVGPVVAEKFGAMRPKLREAGQWHRDQTLMAKAKGEKPSKYETGPAVEHRWRGLVHDLFDIKVLDPAMGSGHFLVETVDYITDRMLDFLNSFPWNPVTAHLDLVRRTIVDQMDEQGITIDERRLTDVNLLKRHVLKRSIYGVDLNPMAVELAKVSLWLHCFTLGAPLSFLDHHMRCGNSLIGVRVADAHDELRQGSLFGNWFAGLMLATDLMRHVGELSDVTSAQVGESKAEYGRASGALAPFKRILDVYTSQWFGNAGAKKPRGKSGAVDSPVIAFLKARETDSFVRARAPVAIEKALAAMPAREQRIAEAALLAGQQKRFFHWELEFPEVFYGARPGTERAMGYIEGAGFDAVLGNPPFDELSETTLGAGGCNEIDFLNGQKSYFSAGSGRLNWYHFFILRAATLVKSHGRQSFIVPMSLLADQFTRSLRRWLLTSNRLVRVEAFPQKDDPRRRIFRDAKLPTCVYLMEPNCSPDRFELAVHRGAEINDGSRAYTTESRSIETLDPTNFTIPLVSESGWRLRQRIAENSRLGKLHEYGATPTSGEIVFNKAFRKYLTTRPTDTLILRGSHVQRYEIVDQAKQGEPMYLRKAEYLREATPGSKAFDFRQPRVVYQECAAIDNWRRVIAAYLPAGQICGHKICYFKEYKCDPMVLLGIFNSRLLDWLVTIVSTNNSLPAYLVGALPFPKVESGVRSTTEEFSDVCTRVLDAAAVDTPSAAEVATELLSRAGLLSDTTEAISTRQACAVGYLAQQMIALRQAQSTGGKSFLHKVPALLGVTKSVDLEAFSGKTVLRNYVGDYQRGESHQSFERIWSILERNVSQLGGTPSESGREKLRGEYDRSLSILLPIKMRMAVTDSAIDQLVFRMYQLHEEDELIVDEALAASS